MSADAAALPCPVCSYSGVFHSVQSLKDRLIHISTNNIVCPVCQEEVCGIDKLTIHLFSHVNVKELSTNPCKNNNNKEKNVVKKDNASIELPAAPLQQKKPKTSAAKNKVPPATQPPVKFVKIYPKLPVVAVNAVTVVDVSKGNASSSDPVYVKTERNLIQSDSVCNICGLQFIDANILRMHKCLIHNIDDNSVQNVTRYNCHLCPKNFKMRGSLMVHLRVAHFGFLSGNCNSDNDAGKTKDGTNSVPQDEKNSLIRNDNKQWQCDVCRKCFTTKYFLKKHKRLHTGETPYACTQCNKTFTFQQSYHKHLLYHNDEKPHICSYCGRAFKELSTLHNHQRIHTGEKPFSCETCGKCFRQRVSYLVHRRIHTGVMPYKCTACQKSFRYKVSQRTHKCQAQPPGTVVRRSGELVEKLKKKQEIPCTQSVPEKISYNEVSEVNAELARTSAMLSLEDLESEHFSLLSETVAPNGNMTATSESLLISPTSSQVVEDIFRHTIDDLIDSIPIVDRNMPSPSEILKNLCLSKEEYY